MEVTDVPSHIASSKMSINVMTAHSSENSESPTIHSQSRVQVRGGSQKGIFFLISRRVTVAYGPYMNLGVLDYRTERLEGMMKALKKIGGEPVLKPSYHVNQVRIWHLEHEIYSCKITDLQHGGDGDLDKHCIIAARLLDKSSRKAHFHMKTRYRLQMHLNEGCPCHPPVVEPHHHGGHQHSHHGDHAHGDNVSSRGSYIDSADSSDFHDSSIHSGHHHGHGHHHDHGQSHHTHPHQHGGEHHHHGHHHHQHESNSNEEDFLGGHLGGEPRPSQSGQLPDRY